ncbi:MAG: chromate efflux transporter [Coraliomargarita sp.]
MPKHSTTLLQIFLIYLRLGCLSFGGPVAHLGYFKEAFVSRRKWLTEAHYAELLGLCQFVPGPSSSQLGFAIGWNQRGLAGGCIAWLGFTLPSAVIMIGFAYGLVLIGESAAPFIQGLLIAAVAIVAKAVIDLGRKLCADAPRILIAAVSAALVHFLTNAYTPLAVIVLGGVAGILVFRKSALNTAPALHDQPFLPSRLMAWSAIAGFSLLLVLALAVPANSSAAIYAMHYRAGALVFGGGHVVLPLLYDGVVPNGLLTEAQFLAGYSGAQALPGPMFALSANLGTAAQSTSPAWLGGIGALAAIFLPGILLLIGLLPLWNRIRSKPVAQAGLYGANAAVVGLLAAALIDPVLPHGVQHWVDALIALIAYLALTQFKVPAWLVVLSCGAIGFAL